MRTAMAEGAGEAMAEESGRELLAEGPVMAAEAEPERVASGAARDEVPAR
jgi:hypothetical protein